MCCSNAAWKREEVPDHKFDFIDVHEFHATNCTTRLQYGWFWGLFLKSIAVYVADIYTAIALFASGHWAASELSADSGDSDVISVPFSVGKWVFFGCILFSFLLLAWESRKARKIIKSRDISYAFTNVLSQNWYGLRSYDHFCFFCQIDNSKKKKDEFAFFIFFTFKGWKRLLLADAPRQVINGISLYSFAAAEDFTTDLSTYFSGSWVRSVTIVTMGFSVLVWAGSFFLLIVAAALYVPLLCYIQGNLKEYCCHKVDKRIAELMKRKTRKRLAKEAEIARKEAAGDYSHLKGKDGKMRAAPLPQPTLPKIGLADDEFYAPSYRGGSDAGSIRNGGGSVRYGQGLGRGYAYPPPANLGANAPYHAGPGGWGANGPSGLSHQQSYRSQPQYAGYAQSDAASIVMPNESVSSFDAFAVKGQPMGYNSNAQLVGPDGRPNLERGATGRSYAPSYRSDGDELAYYTEKNSPPQAYGAEHEADPRLGMASPPPLNPNPSSLQHALSNASSMAGTRPYAPPSREQLYRRATDQPESVDSHGGDVIFGGGGGSTGGHWGGQHQQQQHHQAYSQSGHGHEQEHIQRQWEPVAPPSQQGEGNFAGRGAGVGGQWR